MLDGDTDPEEYFGKGELNEQVEMEFMMKGDGLDIGKEDIAWRKDFINFDEEDEQRLTDLEPTFREHQKEIADRFYENLTQYDESLAVFSRSPRSIDALKQTQAAYLVSLATGSYGQSYFADRARIGMLHYQLEMPLRQYIGQYGVYYSLMLSILNERMQTDVIEAVEDWAESQDGGSSGGLLGLGGSNDDIEMTDELEQTIRDSIDDGMSDLLSVLRVFNLDMQVGIAAYVHSQHVDSLSEED